MNKFTLMLIAFIVSASFAAQIGVELVPQEKDQWCWAATSEAILKFYGLTELTQTEIVTHVKGSPVNQTGGGQEIANGINDFLECNAQAVSPLQESELKSRADNKNPLGIGWMWNQGGGHIVVYDGYKDDGTHVIMDPWEPNVGKWTYFTSYSALKSHNNKGNWREAVTTEYEVGPTDTINVTAPTGSDEWEQGVEKVISWEDNLDGNVKIELYKGSSLSATISASTPSNGSFTWTVPEDQAIGSNYTVKISSVDNQSVTASSDQFSVVEGSLEEYTLTVEGGDGDGDYVKGTAVEISADAAPEGKMFDKWSGTGAQHCANVNSATTILTMPEGAVTVTSTYKDRPESSENFVILNSWESETDSTSAIAVDSSEVSSDTIVSVDYSRGTPASDEDGTWAILCGYLDTAQGAFDNVTAVEITYKSDCDILVSLPQAGLDGSYECKLPKSTAWSSKLINIDTINFKQPQWAIDAGGSQVKPLNISECSGVGVAADIGNDNSGSISLKMVCLIGYKEPVAIVNPGVTKHTFAVNSISRRNLSLSVPSSEVYEISIYSLNGKKIFTESRMLTAGVQNIGWNGAELANQMLIANIKSVSGLSMKRRVLLK